jgi:hypothetical protein
LLTTSRFTTGGLTLSSLTPSVLRTSTALLAAGGFTTASGFTAISSSTASSGAPAKQRKQQEHQY